jgi:DNA-binding HxlR family transcriptional regulator
MEGYAQFCPIAKATEVIGRRWTLLILRELLCGSHQFNDIHRGVPKMSRSLLAKRLGELEAEGLVERRVTSGEHPEYHLTDSGEALRPIVVELGNWGKRWVGQGVSERDLDARLLMWDVQRRIERDRLPERRVVVCFRFPDAPEKQKDFWLVLERDQVDLCLKDPGYEEDLYVTSDVESFTKIWLGDTHFDRALHNGDVSLSGPSRLRTQFPRWLGLSMFAGIRREYGPAAG